MQTTKFLISSFALLSLSANAAMVEPVASGAKIEAKDVYKSAAVKTPNGNLNVELAGAGVREGCLAFICKNVYVGQLLVNPLAKLDRNVAKAVASLDDMSAVVLRMSFVYDLKADKMRSSFQTALKKNEKETKGHEDAVAEFLKAVGAGGDVAKDDVLDFIGERLADGSEVVYYENHKTGAVATIKGKKGMMRAIFSIWIGDTAHDDGLDDMKNDILKGRNK